jgi:DNA (cytosine-5)-methyltransferase 1
MSYNLNATSMLSFLSGKPFHRHCLSLCVYVLVTYCCSYQVRFCLLQAAHYGTPQTRVRFFLFGAKRGYPLLAAPQPTHDFPQTHKLEVRFPNGDIAPTVRAEEGTAPFKFVTIDDAINDLPRFDWCASLPLFLSRASPHSDNLLSI